MIMETTRNVFIFFTFVIFYNFSAYAQVVGFNANVEEYGQLKASLGEEWDKIDSLSVSGPINAVDFRTIWECAFYGKLSVLNLENAQVENNRIPNYALCDVNKQYWDSDKTIYLGIRKIILPDDIVEIGVSAFNYMQLEKINFPVSLRMLNQYSFANCHWLNVDPLIIPEGVTEIPGQCFANCQSFRKLILPSSLRTICDLAFYNTRISEVSFSENLDSIGFAAFEGSALLTKAVIPSSCKKIGGFVFNHCENLREIIIPSGIKRIPNSFAALCAALETIDIPETVTDIGTCSFQYCFALKNINLPEGLKTIGADAFSYCNPDSVVFPKSLEYIGRTSCDNWQNIKKIYSKSFTPPNCDKTTFGGISPTDIPVYVPIGSADLYRNAQGWNYFTNFIEIDEFPSAGIYGIKTDTHKSSNAYWSNGSLNIVIFDESELPTPYSIYTIAGRLVDSGTLSSSCYSIQIPKGVYIVKIGRDVHKVA